MKTEWLSLSEAADLLGVHPSTVRNWADRGKLPVQRTRGGHRRFRRADVDLWSQSQRLRPTESADLIIQNAVGRTRLQIDAGQLEAEDWFQKLDEEARDQYRRSGRALLQGMNGYLSTRGATADKQARATGIEYASIGRRCGLSRLEAAQALMFFRGMLLESLISVYESAAIQSPHAWGDMLRKINTFADQVLLALLEEYQRFTD
ncbi:MAG TPA: helix-turn-helix domain-containing protein [Anaerolineales bacterium]|nr:helix-turn-helix domain-containing protein [Anaerolineales bacterium]